ncbi:MAG: amidase domain-containing protein [Clostridia bacterium]|nr:amidase domain-containing protein [Clostridia bacterium]
MAYDKTGDIMKYDRAWAVAYARRWALGRNPKYYDFSYIGGDCTNFASQCIFAGAGVMNKTPLTGWYYINANNRTPSWTGVEELYRFLVNNHGAGPRGRVVPLDNIREGDIVQLRFDGSERFGHSPVVVDAGRGTPETVLIAAHSRDSIDRPLSSYEYSEIRPIHIVDVGNAVASTVPRVLADT